MFIYLRHEKNKMADTLAHFRVLENTVFSYIFFNLYRNLPSKYPPVKASIYSLHLLAFTGGTYSGNYGIYVKIHKVSITR